MLIIFERIHIFIELLMFVLVNFKYPVSKSRAFQITFVIHLELKNQFTDH